MNKISFKGKLHIVPSLGQQSLNNAYLRSSMKKKRAEKEALKIALKEQNTPSKSSFLSKINSFLKTL